MFKITPGGTFTSLYSFTGGAADGGNPFGALIQATDGYLYGTVQTGGINSGGVFRTTPAGSTTMIRSFADGEGGCSYSGLAQGTDGNFYGVTSTSDTCSSGGNGTLYQMTPAGELTILNSFNLTDGDFAEAPLMQHTNGRFYGNTAGGGTGYAGTIFTLAMGLQPFVRMSAASAKVGATVRILGTKLTGATSVTFNSAAATFTVVSQSLITTTVVNPVIFELYVHPR